MCHERYLRRRREADESRAIWQDFESTQPVGDPEPPEPEAVTEPAPAKGDEAVAVPDR
jgi:hypothetical protein